jgi:hypothetical protein
MASWSHLLSALPTHRWPLLMVQVTAEMHRRRLWLRTKERSTASKLFVKRESKKCSLKP